MHYYATEVHLAAGDFSGSKITTHRIVHRVIAVISRLQSTPIKFHNTAREIKATQLGFYRIILLVFHYWLELWTVHVKITLLLVAWFLKTFHYHSIVPPLSSPPRRCPWDLLRSVQILKRERERERGCRKQWEATAPIHP